MARVAAHDDIRVACSGERKVLVVLRVAAFAHSIRRLNSLSGDNHDVEKTLTASDGREPIELWTEDDFPVLVLNLPRQDQAVGFRRGAKQGSLRNAVCFEGRGYKRRSVENDDQAYRSARHAASSASTSSSVRPLARASRLTSAMASARTAGI